MKKKIIFLILLIFVFLGLIFVFFKKGNKETSNYNLSYNMDDIIANNTIFSAYVASNLEENGIIKQELFKYSDVLDKGNYINVYNKSVEETKKEVEDFFKVENNDFKKIKADTMSYSYFLKNSSFPYQFDISENSFGVNTSSESGLFSIITYNYYIDENNYSLSLIDDKDCELIYMKSDSIKDKSYLDLYIDFLDNKCNNQEIILFGRDLDDSALFPITQINLNNKKINDELVQNYYYGTNINISGTGNYLGSENILDKDNIKYNFTENSILFIKRQDCQYPNIIIPLNI